MTPIHVVGVGMDGLSGLAPALQRLIHQAAVLVGSDRHLAYVESYTGRTIPLTDLAKTIRQVRQWVAQSQTSNPDQYVVVLTSGDPLFFGLGRLLLAELPPEWLTFHPAPSSIQLAFSRIKAPWQDAELISAHGRSPDRLLHTIRRQPETIAILTDSIHTPQAIAQMLVTGDLSQRYVLWVCEDLGAESERVQCFKPEELAYLTDIAFASLNVVVLVRQDTPTQVDITSLPTLGLADSSFASFSDRPNLITKREVRVLVLAELELQDQTIVWDIGAGTGSVSIEIARLCPSSQVYAVEKTAAGASLNQQNFALFGLENVHSIYGTAPACLEALPNPDRIFIGGSGGHLEELLTYSERRLSPGGVVVLAIATLEHLSQVTTWANQHSQRWQAQFLQVQLARSTPVASLTRLSPLNPVTIVQLKRLPHAT